MPSRPILQAWAKTVRPSPSIQPCVLVSSSSSEDLRPSIHSICSASSSQPRATSSNALFMDGLLVCAARFLASAALCRYSSDRDDMQGEHWKDASVPQIHFRHVSARGTPAAVLQKLNGQVAAILQNADVREQFGKLGITPLSMSPQKFAQHVRSEIAVYRRIVKQAGIPL